MAEQYQIFTASEAVIGKMDKAINDFLRTIDVKNIHGFHRTSADNKHSCTVVYKTEK